MTAERQHTRSRTWPNFGTLLRSMNSSTHPSGRGLRLGAFAVAAVVLASVRLVSAEAQPIRVTENADRIEVETDLLRASIAKRGYVSGIMGGSFVDKTTGAKDLGFGLHVMDFLLAPGWADDGYERDAKIHGNLPKHFVEGPQICTQAKVLQPRIIRGSGFVAIRMSFRYNQPARGMKAGSLCTQTIVFRPGVRYVLSGEQITSANTVDDLFYRLDMPGHIRHHGGDTFEQVYLSYLDKPIAASQFDHPFGPDEKFLYQRRDGHVPVRFIRAYQVKLSGKPGPWLAGMTLDPSEVAEAWCHERGYVCFIEELHRRHANAGETFGAAYVIGWFDGIPQMQRVYDQYKGVKRLDVDNGKLSLEK